MSPWEGNGTGCHSTRHITEAGQLLVCTQLGQLGQIWSQNLKRSEGAVQSEYLHTICEALGSPQHRFIYLFVCLFFLWYADKGYLSIYVFVYLFIYLWSADEG